MARADPRMPNNNNRNRIDRTLLLLGDGLRIFAEREFEVHYGSAWAAEAQRTLDPRGQREDGDTNWDVAALFTLIERHWEPVFSASSPFRK